MITPRPLIYPKPLRLPKVKLMTMIAAFRCMDGIVLCADSQESWGECYKVTVSKIAGEWVNDFRLGYGGAGLSDLVDALFDKITDSMHRWNAETIIKRELEEVLIRFHKRQVSPYPAPSEDKTVRAITFCFRRNQQEKESLFYLSGTTVHGIDRFKLVGFEIPFYKQLVEEICRPSLSISEAILIGAYVFSVAKATCHHISGPTRIIVVRNRKVYSLEETKVKEFEERIDSFRIGLNMVMLSCSDLSMPDQALTEHIRAFEKMVIGLRQEYRELTNLLPPLDSGLA